MPFRRFRADCNGNVGIILGLASVPLFGAIGIAIDYSTAKSARTEMWAAADSSALAVAKEAYKLTSAQISQEGSDYFYADFHRSTTKVGQIAAAYDQSKKTVTVDASGTVKTAFMQLFHVSQMSSGVHSVALAANDELGCVLSLSGTVHRQFELCYRLQRFRYKADRDDYRQAASIEQLGRYQS